MIGHQWVSVFEARPLCSASCSASSEPNGARTDMSSREYHRLDTHRVVYSLVVITSHVSGLRSPYNHV